MTQLQPSIHFPTKRPIHRLATNKKHEKKKKRRKEEKMFSHRTEDKQDDGKILARALLSSLELSHSPTPCHPAGVSSSRFPTIHLMTAPRFSYK